MATLLTMINDLRDLLREEQVGSISATDDYTQALIPLVNRAARKVLESRIWSFDKRHDGSMIFRERVTGTNLKTTGETRAEVETFTGFAFFCNATTIARFRATSDTIHPNLSYQVTEIDSTTVPGKIQFVLSPGWMGDFPVDETDATWELYTNEYVLPSTVRKILSVRDEDQPLQLLFSEKEIFQDRVEPRSAYTRGDPSVAVVSGKGTTTFLTSTPNTISSGIILSLWPVPTVETIIYYDYVYKHPAMSSGTDTLSQVPDHVIDLIVQQAFYYCLISNIEADPVRAARVEKQLTIDRLIAERDDRLTPNRRRIMRPVGSYFGRHPNSRWSTREVPSP